MTNLTESPVYEAGVYQIETDDPILGGPPGFNLGEPVTGWANAQAQQLANRSAYLKNKTDVVLPADVARRQATFDSVAALVADTKVVVGDKVRTLGYYTPGDGGGNDYDIVAAGTGTVDGGSFINLTGITGQAKGLFPDGYVRIEQFGCKIGDLDHDSAAALVNAFGFALTNGYKLTGGVGEIYCGAPVTIYPASIVARADIDIPTVFVFANNTSGFSIGNFRESTLKFAGTRTLTGTNAATAGTGFTKDTMQNCKLAINYIFGFKDGFLNTSQAADYYNHIDLGYIAASATAGYCIYIDTAFYSNENQLTTKFMSGWKGIGARDLTGETFNEYNGWKFLNIGFENIAHTGFEPKTFNRCALLYPRFEGGSPPSTWWINEDSSNSSTTYLNTHDVNDNLLNLNGVLTLWVGRVRDTGGSVIYDHVRRTSGSVSTYQGVKKETNTKPRTHLIESNLVSDRGLWERWAGYVVDAGGTLRRYGLLDEYGTQNLGAVSGAQSVNSYNSSYVKLSTTAGGPVTLTTPVNKEFEGNSFILEISFYTDTIEIKKSTGATVIAAGAIAATGTYSLLYFGGTWVWTRLGDKYQ